MTSSRIYAFGTHPAERIPLPRHMLPCLAWDSSPSSETPRCPCRLLTISFTPNLETGPCACVRTSAFLLSTMAAMLEFRTQGYNPYAVKYSPYYDSRIAVATSANFGIVGNGRVFALGLTAQGVQVEKTYVGFRSGCEEMSV